MGLKGLMSTLGMDPYAMVALVLFFGTFVAIIIRVATRPRKEIEAYARLPIEDDDACFERNRGNAAGQAGERVR